VRMTHEPDGAILAARHSFMPNRLGYCGPDENEVLLDACLKNQRSKQLIKTLEGFEGAQGSNHGLIGTIADVEPT
jgi:hypothetical protein